MDCRQTQDLLSPYLDSQLSAEQKAAVDDHLRACQACSREFTEAERLSRAVRALPDPSPPATMWDALESQTVGVSVVPFWRTRATRIIGVFSAVAAAVLLAAMLIWPRASDHHGHSPMAQRFSQFMEDFAEQPELAQSKLMAEYQGRSLDTAAAAQTVALTPVALRTPPAGYAVAGAYVLEMPCCQCTQTILRSGDGRQIAIFEHNTSQQPDWFGDCPCVQTQCKGNACTLVQVGDRLAASCEVKGRHYTIVGTADMDELETVVAWLDQEDTDIGPSKEKT